MHDIKRWLESHDLGKYVEVFVDNAVDMDVPNELTMDKFEDLEVPLGARKRFLKAIAACTDARSNQEATSVQPMAPPSRDAERRQLTVMFCDLIGSTALSESMDAEDYRGVIATYQSAVTSVVTANDGYLARFMGDGLLIYFGYPEAHENDPERAARGGLATVETVGAISVRNDLQVRVSIATGAVVIGNIIGESAPKEVTALGETPNLEARL